MFYVKMYTGNPVPNSHTTNSIILPNDIDLLQKSLDPHMKDHKLLLKGDLIWNLLQYQSFFY